MESLMYLWRLTGNKTYKDWGWNIFQAFERHSRIDSGYVGLKDVSFLYSQVLLEIHNCGGSSGRRSLISGILGSEVGYYQP